MQRDRRFGFSHDVNSSQSQIASCRGNHLRPRSRLVLAYVSRKRRRALHSAQRLRDAVWFLAFRAFERKNDNWPELISQTAFIPAKRCAKCHTSTHAEWNESAHRNAFREPFYQANVNHLIRDQGIVPTRHCESCHNPVALFSGALSKNAKMQRPFDDEGVTCSVCHSIQSTTTEGIGSYTIAPPAMLELKDGRRQGANLKRQCPCRS